MLTIGRVRLGAHRGAPLVTITRPLPPTGDQGVATLRLNRNTVLSVSGTSVKILPHNKLNKVHGNIKTDRLPSIS